MLSLEQGSLGDCQNIADEGMHWGLLGSCIDQLEFGAPFLEGKGDALAQGVRSKAGESIRTFLCQHRAKRRLFMGCTL